MRKFYHSLLVMIMAITSLLLVSCGDDDGAEVEENMTSEIRLTNNSTLGEILTDGDGRTLYFFANDTKGESTCIEGCVDIWPVVYIENPEVGAGLNASDFGAIARADGAMQTTYKNRPLYYYAPNADGIVEDAGETKGEAVNNVWFVAKTDYTIMMANAQLVGADDKNYTGIYEEGDGMTLYFVDGEGRTLYTFIKDAEDFNSFTAPDFSNDGVWPIFHEAIASLPSVLNAEDFETIQVYGEMQLTYKGWPLYYFGQDASLGDNKGISFPSPGVWPVPTIDLTAAPTYSGPTVKLTSNADFETVITDHRGQTLYFFSNDADGKNNCTGGCADLWPVFHAEISLAEGSELDMADFSEIALDGGGMQTTYKGYPLYYYSPNGDGTLENAGATTGDNFNGVWYVAKHDYTLMLSNTQLVGHDGNNYTSDYEEGTGMTKYFTDSYGRTLYIFINDTRDNNNFTAEDFSNNGVWPIYYEEVAQLPSALDATEFGEIDVFGQKQMTFRGWPLYYFGQDEMTRGHTKGVSFPAPGVWPIANNDLAQAQ